MGLIDDIKNIQSVSTKIITLKDLDKFSKLSSEIKSDKVIKKYRSGNYNYNKPVHK